MLPGGGAAGAGPQFSDGEVKVTVPRSKAAVNGP